MDEQFIFPEIERLNLAMDEAELHLNKEPGGPAVFHYAGNANALGAILVLLMGEIRDHGNGKYDGAIWSACKTMLDEIEESKEDEENA